MSNTLLVSSAGRTATLGSLAQLNELPGQTEINRENLQRMVEVTARLEKHEPGQGDGQGAESGGRIASAFRHSRDLRRQVRAAAERFS